MAAPLAVCTKEEQRAVIRFLWSEGVPGAEIHRRLSTQYGDNALPRRRGYEWIEKCKSGRTSVTHEEGAGRPSTSTTDKMIQQAREMVLANRRVAIDELACSLQISHGSTYRIIHDELSFHKVCARWVPRELTAELKRKRVENCQHLLDRYNIEGEEILSRIVTGDEKWVHHYEPESKRQRMEWKHPGSPEKKKFKTQPSAGKVMLTVFWDLKGSILEDYLEKGRTINSARYSDLLFNNLKLAVRTKRRGLLSKKVLLLHDNAHPHTVSQTVETINHLSFEVLEHPAYSPELAPSDYHLFGTLKNALQGRRFSTDKELREAVHNWLRDQPKTFFLEGIRKLVDR